MNRQKKRLLKAFKREGVICLYDIRAYYNKSYTNEQRIQSLINATYKLKSYRRYKNIVRDKHGQYNYD